MFIICKLTGLIVNSLNLGVHTWMEFDRPGGRSPEKDSRWCLMFQFPERKSSSESLDFCHRQSFESIDSEDDFRSGSETAVPTNSPSQDSFHPHDQIPFMYDRFTQMIKFHPRVTGSPRRSNSINIGLV